MKLCSETSDLIREKYYLCYETFYNSMKGMFIGKYCGDDDFPRLGPGLYGSLLDIGMYDRANFNKDFWSVYDLEINDGRQMIFELDYDDILSTIVVENV